MLLRVLFLKCLDRLGPFHIEDAQTIIRNLRRKTEAWASRVSDCPFCGNERHRMWQRAWAKIGAVVAVFVKGQAVVDPAHHSSHLPVRSVFACLSRHAGHSYPAVGAQAGAPPRTRQTPDLASPYACIQEHLNADTSFCGMVESGETYQQAPRTGLANGFGTFANPIGVAQRPRSQKESCTSQD